MEKGKEQKKAETKVVAEISDFYVKQYEKAIPKPNKFLLSDGSVVDENGDLIVKSEYFKKQYEQANPIPLKYLHPDGTIDENGGGGGGGSTTVPVIEVEESSTISNIENDIRIIIKGDGISLNLSAASSDGISAEIFTQKAATINFNLISDTLQALENVKMVYIDGEWQILQKPAELVYKATNKKPFGTLVCDGTVLNDATKYPRLWEELSVSDGQGGQTGLYNISGDSNNVRRLPDLREVSVVGAGQNATNSISSHDVYSVGQFKDDQFKSHAHNVYVRDTGHAHSINTSAGAATAAGANFFSPAVGVIGLTTNSGNAVIQVNSNSSFTGSDNTTSSSGGETTHGKQMGMLVAITY